MKNMFKLSIVTFLLSAANVLGAKVHLKGGRNAEPKFEDAGMILVAIGELAGLGNGDVLISLAAQANVIATCTNQGGTQAPGQNPAPMGVEGAVEIPEEEIKNGNLPFEVETEPPDPVIIPADDDRFVCPNPNWTQEITDLEFFEATITVEQPVGTVVLTVECDIDPATSDGLVDKADVECTQIFARRLHA